MINSNIEKPINPPIPTKRVKRIYLSIFSKDDILKINGILKDILLVQEFNEIKQRFSGLDINYHIRIILSVDEELTRIIKINKVFLSFVDKIKKQASIIKYNYFINQVQFNDFDLNDIENVERNAKHILEKIYDKKYKFRDKYRLHRLNLHFIGIMYIFSSTLKILTVDNIFISNVNNKKLLKNLEKNNFKINDDLKKVKDDSTQILNKNKELTLEKKELEETIRKYNLENKILITELDTVKSDRNKHYLRENTCKDNLVLVELKIKELKREKGYCEEDKSKIITKKQELEETIKKQDKYEKELKIKLEDTIKKIKQEASKKKIINEEKESEEELNKKFEIEKESFYNDISKYQQDFLKDFFTKVSLAVNNSDAGKLMEKSAILINKGLEYTEYKNNIEYINKKELEFIIYYVVLRLTTDLYKIKKENEELKEYKTQLLDQNSTLKMELQNLAQSERELKQKKSQKDITIQKLNEQLKKANQELQKANLDVQNVQNKNKDTYANTRDIINKTRTKTFNNFFDFMRSSSD